MDVQTAILVLIIGTTIWVAVDSSGRQWPHRSFANRPWKWVLGMLLIWIVTFPVYLAQRGKAPRRA